MDITKWEDTWGTINWYKEPENVIKQKITDFFHAGVDFNMIDYNNCNCMPLDLAAKYSTVGVIDLLIDGGADINLTDEYGFTPLHWAAYNGKTENVKYLIERGPSNRVEFINKQSNEGNITALHRAAYCGHEETVWALIKVGADVNKQNKKGETALHMAVYFGYVEIAKALIKAGVDVNIKDDDGKSALNRAKNKEIKEYIQNADKIRAEYLENHPNTSGGVSGNPNKIFLIKNPKTR